MANLFQYTLCRINLDPTPTRALKFNYVLMDTNILILPVPVRRRPRQFRLTIAKCSVSIANKLLYCTYERALSFEDDITDPDHPSHVQSKPAITFQYLKCSNKKLILPHAQWIIQNCTLFGGVVIHNKVLFPPPPQHQQQKEQHAIQIQVLSIILILALALTLFACHTHGRVKWTKITTTHPPTHSLSTPELHK